MPHHVLSGWWFGTVFIPFLIQTFRWGNVARQQGSSFCALNENDKNDSWDDDPI